MGVKKCMKYYTTGKTFLAIFIVSNTVDFLLNFVLGSQQQTYRIHLFSKSEIFTTI